MYQAKLLKLDDLIEEEVTVEVNGLQFVGFASVCPYKIMSNMIYPINIGLTFLDGPDIIELHEPQPSLERIDMTYGYILSGQVCGDSIDIGNGIKIQDDIFNESPYLDGQFIKIRVDRLSVEFI
jgi:hypothetical protein